MSARFANQKLIVVGGTSGMGKAVARILLEEGGRAVVIGHRDDKLQAAVAELAAPGPVEGLRADIASGTERQALVAQLQKDHADATLLVGIRVNESRRVRPASCGTPGARGFRGIRPRRRGDSRHVGDVLGRGARLSGRSSKRCHSRRQARHIPE